MKRDATEKGQIFTTEITTRALEFRIKKSCRSMSKRPITQEKNGQEN